ncbi:hypothetical protein FXO37_00892 [Capsicum annuum]|nr:hypothetical protein FXO37_00892 [Capsicum annuum]
MELVIASGHRETLLEWKNIERLLPRFQPHLMHRSLVLDVSLGYAKSNLLPFFSVTEKRSLPLAFQNNEYEVREAAGTMDPLTPNRVAFPGLVGVAFHDTMEHLRQDEIKDLSLSPPAVGSMQIAGSNGFGHNIEFISQAYLRNRSSKIDIEVEDDTSIADKDQTLPIFLKFADVEYKVNISKSSSNNPVKVVVSKVASQFEHDNYKQILMVRRRKGEILALMGPSGSGKTTLLKILGGKLQENVRGTVTYNDIPYNIAINKRNSFYDDRHKGMISFTNLDIRLPDISEAGDSEVEKSSRERFMARVEEASQLAASLPCALLRFIF